MEYPLPIDAAGRTVLITLCAGYIRHGGLRVGGLSRLRPRPELWLDDLGKLGLRRSAIRWSCVLGPAILELAVLGIVAAWSGYALLRLAEDLRENVIASLAGALPASAMAGRVARGKPP